MLTIFAYGGDGFRNLSGRARGKIAANRMENNVVRRKLLLTVPTTPRLSAFNHVNVATIGYCHVLRYSGRYLAIVARATMFCIVSSRGKVFALGSATTGRLASRFSTE